MKKSASTHGGVDVGGVVRRVPDSDEEVRRWVAESTHGYVAHGTTAAHAMRRLEEYMRQRAEAAGQSFESWLRAQERVRTRRD